MNTVALAASRKAIAFAVTALSMMLLQRLGMSPEDLSASYGINLGEAQEWAIDFLMVVALPTFIGWLQPNEIGRSIFDYWKQGLAGIIAIGGGIAVLWYFV